MRLISGFIRVLSLQFPSRSQAKVGKKSLHSSFFSFFLFALLSSLPCLFSLLVAVRSSSHVSSYLFAFRCCSTSVRWRDYLYSLSYASHHCGETRWRSGLRWTWSSCCQVGRCAWLLCNRQEKDSIENYFSSLLISLRSLVSHFAYGWQERRREKVGRKGLHQLER